MDRKKGECRRVKNARKQRGSQYNLRLLLRRKAREKKTPSTTINRITTYIHSPTNQPF